MELTNPHSHFYLDVKDDKGKVINWKLEGYNPAVLYRIGWKKDLMLKVGDKITVFGWQARDGGNWAHSREITLPNGKKFFFGPPSGTGDGDLSGRGGKVMRGSCSLQFSHRSSGPRPRMLKREAERRRPRKRPPRAPYRELRMESPILLECGKAAARCADHGRRPTEALESAAAGAILRRR